jgi:hypothetical protein
MAVDIKLASGIKVSVIENGNSKLLLFDKAVKVMELSRNESKQLGSSLMKNGRTAIGVKDRPTPIGSEETTPLAK